ncbi:hypothetical protein ACFLWR_05540 [Chloroflexota bacterium]
METMTITEDAMSAVANLCNKAILEEYDIIFGYPKLIDHITNFENIKDAQLVRDVEIVGKDSLAHYRTMDLLITRLGYTPAWQAGVLPTIVGILDVMEAQLYKERRVQDIYKEAKKFTLENQKKIRARKFFGKIITVRAGVGEDVLTTNEIVNTLDRLIMDEGKHARLIENSMATLNMYLKRMPS